MLTVRIPRPGRQRAARSRSARYRSTAAPIPSPPLFRLLVDVDFGRCEAATAGLVDVPADGDVL
jgi:hypothetical protein